MLKYQEVGEILSLIDSSSCDEVVLETEGVKLVVRRHGSGSAVSSATAPPAATETSQPTIVNPAPSQSAETPAAAAFEGAGGEVVRSPMVGTFYAAPSPDEPPFVEVGSRIHKGDPLCMIEVMKLFTTVHAETEGTVRSIGAENGQLVEFGQVLFSIEPN
ncbi:MAG: acetyl-CoA carboxylase biotin carboxyl carrier protein [Pseudomonadota bacterium]|uniref:acetyl-CoA carboxylase biotin carboxyl carrier protein n=1 Tax=Roseovarius salincola TaxID=2978479 RepID=UPI0022A8CAFB|nr:acetyl-CoA carboxylase biotin carboxyl carrier protein [Roseovarius sp. EGI FJ00037]MCZ0814294.1 acetyl-CoA carboxylase biotin carboxyl carrier protein [Roseovarius sp. EGI FJ00037]